MVALMIRFGGRIVLVVWLWGAVVVVVDTTFPMVGGGSGGASSDTTLVVALAWVGVILVLRLSLPGPPRLEARRSTEVTLWIPPMMGASWEGSGGGAPAFLSFLYGADSLTLGISLASLSTSPPAGREATVEEGLPPRVVDAVGYPIVRVLCCL